MRNFSRSKREQADGELNNIKRRVSIIQAIFSRDIKLIEECDAIVAEVSTPSLGVGYEICYGLQIGKPILCLYKEGIKLSQMIFRKHASKYPSS